MYSLVRGNSNLFNDDIFDAFFGLSNNYEKRKGSNFANVINTDEGYEIELIVPGFSTSDFNIEIDNNLLIISGEYEGSNKNYSSMEYSVNSFERRFTLPKGVNIDGINADYNAGILKIGVPYSRERQNTKRIIEIG
jgi:HSP20 family protein